jgi:hypothetical protein
MYGTKLRDVSPETLSVNHLLGSTLSKQQIDEIASFNAYLKTLPNIDFNKYTSKKESE